MTTTTQKLAAAKRRRIGTRSAFSLVEVMVAATLGALIMGGVMSAFLFIGRSTVNMRNYADMETEARNAMETFAQDVRMASATDWVRSGTDGTTLIITTKYAGEVVKYTYVYTPSTSNSKPNGTLTRQRTSPTTGTAEALISNIRTLTFTAYDINTSYVALASVTNAANDSADKNTKQIQLSIETQRSNPTLAISTNKVMSARFILRNKSVTA